MSMTARFSWIRLRQMVKKEVKQTVRDPKARPLIFVAPIIQMILLGYAIFRRDPVFILGQSTGFIVYTRNLMLIYRKRAASQNFAPS